MEARQSHLIKALTAVTRHVRQPVGERELNEILETVRKCGFDFEGVGDQLNITKPISEIFQGREPKDAEGGNGNHSRKRKGREETLDGNRIPTQVADANEYSHHINVDTVMSFQQQDLSKHQPFLEPVDDYWNLDAYWDQVAAPFQTVPTTDPSEDVPPHRNYPLRSQDQADSLNRMPDDMFQSSCNPDLHMKSIDALSAAGLNSSIDSDVAFSSLSTFSQPEWESTLWWDPSLLFNMTSDTSPS